MSAPENPPAFPRTGEGFGNPKYDEPGMTLRDWFAGQAPPIPEGYADDQAPKWPESAVWSEYGVEHNLRIEAWRATRQAKWAYAYADAMLTARKQP